MYKVKTAIKRTLRLLGLAAPEAPAVSKEVFINDRRLTAPASFPIGFWKNIKTYNRFLPFMVERVSDAGLVIDIGANIGDTMYSILDHCRCGILCVEPSDMYYPYLMENTSALEPENRGRLRLQKKLIGRGLYDGELVDKHGTAKFEIKDDRRSEYTSLDELCGEDASISLIKVDTDGYDFDVLLSGLNALKKHEPILFFENQIEFDFQKQGFKELYKALSDQGYDQVHVFDNFGNYMLGTNDFAILESVNEYIFTQVHHGCKRTLGYTDILVGKRMHVPVMEEAIEAFKTKCILSS